MRTGPRPLWMVIAVWIVLTLISAPFMYGLALLITVPVLAAMSADLYIGSSRTAAPRLLSWVLGPLLLIAAMWFIGRADEDRLEAVASALTAIATTVALRRIRRHNRRAGPPQLTEREFRQWQALHRDDGNSPG